MTDQEAYTKYKAELSAPLGYSLVLELDKDLEIICSHLFSQYLDKHKLVNKLESEEKEFIILDNYKEGSLFTFVGK